ncbi:MAG TPA: FtsX-like permease family protein [Candidatus Aquilonibacter sp.]|nr:FtsX-like permease family protein [Candidatus Aquilonibacter sp.]
MTAPALLFSALVSRYARRHLLRSIVTLVAVALGVASAYAIDLANATAIGSFSTSVNVIANRVNVQVVGAGEGFDERAILRVQGVDGVRAASPVVSGDLLVGSRGGFTGEIVRVLGIDVTRTTAPPGLAQAQRTATHFDLERFIDDRGIFVSERIARTYWLKEGGTLHALVGSRPVSLRVMGIIPRNTVGVDSSVAFVDIATAQTTFDAVGRLDRIDVEADPSRVAAVVEAMKRVVPAGARVLTPRTRLDEIQRMLASFTMNLAALADVALLVGMYLIYNAVAISVVQRGSEIGTLRALGTRRIQIFGIFVSEGAAYGVAGSLLGIVLGLLLARLSLSAVETTVSTLYVGTHADALQFSWLATIKAFALGTVLAMLSAAIPAAGAASTPAARTMRNTGAAERRIAGFTRGTLLAGIALLLVAAAAARLPAIGDGIPVFGYVAGILAIAGVSLVAPFVLTVVTNALHRGAQRATTLLATAFVRASMRRIAVAVASLTVAVAMMIAIAVLVGSFRATVVAWTSDTLSADLYISAPGGADAALHGAFAPDIPARIARLPGVAAVDTFRGLDVPIDGRFAQLGATNFSGIVTRNKLRFLGQVDRAALSAKMQRGNYAVISVPFATHFHLEPGDAFAISTPSGVVSLRILAEYNDYSTSGGTFFIDESTFRRLFKDPNFDSIAVYVRPGASVPAVRTEIARALRPLLLNINSNGELRTYALSVFDRTFAITSALYGISIAIAVLGVISTLFALVLERRTDIGLMRYVGLTAAGVQRLVFVQALIVGVVAGILGLVLGIALAADLIYVINRQSFGWLIEWQTPGWFYLQAFAMVVVAAVAAAIYPARVAASIQTSEVLRVE